MPIYEYQCAACGHHLEKLQKASAEPLKECPNCGKLELQKLISHTSFKLTGTGWYETDFKHKSGNATDSKDTAKTENAVKSDVKPAAKQSNDTQSASSTSKE